MYKVLFIISIALFVAEIVAGILTIKVIFESGLSL